MKPLSVVFLNPILGEGWGGVEKWMIAVGTYLIGRGHHVTVAGCPHTRWLRSGAEAGFPVLPLTMRGDYYPGDVWDLRKYIGEHQIDLICVKMPQAIRLASLAAMFFADPRPAIVCRMGDSVMKQGLRSRLTYKLLVDGYITPSEQTRHELLDYGFFGPDRIDCIPNGIGSTGESNKIRQRVRESLGLTDQKLVIVNSRLHPSKGHEYLFQAIRQLDGSVPVQLLVVGNGTRRGELESMVSDMGLKQKVTFAGFRNDVTDLLQGADLAVLPSLLEGLPNSLLEAMSVGTPVVATAIGGVPEVVSDGDNGLLVKPADPNALARAMKRLLTDNTLARRMGLAGMKRVERVFSLEKMLKRTESVFLARRQRRRLRSPC